MSAMASQITSLTIVYSIVYSGTDQRKHHSSVSLAYAEGIQRWPVNSPHKGSVTQTIFPFDDVIMEERVPVDEIYRAWSSNEFQMSFIDMITCQDSPVQWRHNERVGVSNYQRLDCLLRRLFRCRIKENIKAPRHWSLRGEHTGAG